MINMSLLSKTKPAKSAKADDLFEAPGTIGLAEMLGDEPQMAAPPAPIDAAPVLIPFSIFDQLGHVRKDLSTDAALVEQMGEAQRSLLMITLSACQEAEQSEQRISDLRLALNRKIYEHDLCVLAAEKAAVPMSHQEALAAVLHANNSDVVPKPKGRRPGDPKPALALRKAADKVTALRLEFQNENFKLRELSRRRGEAIGKWVREGQPVLTDETIRRQYLARDGAERLGLANGTIIPPVVAPVKTWPIEDAMIARGKTKNKPQYFGSVKR
jgi:hypothetical protein